MKPSTEKQKESMRKWYIKNKEKHIENVKKRQKENNYSSEKTYEQKKIRYIKRKTRFKFPLINEKCKFCNSKATEHHHNTMPIEYDKFWFICHDCHIKKDLELNCRSKLIKNRLTNS